MNKKRKIIIVLLVVLTALILAISIGLVYIIQPRPIVPDRDGLMIGYIKVIKGEGSDLDIEVLEYYDEENILEFLRSANEKARLGDFETETLDEIDLEIYIHEKSGEDYAKVIILGDVNYSDDPDASYIFRRRYEIVDPDYVKAALMEMLGISAD